MISWMDIAVSKAAHELLKELTSKMLQLLEQLMQQNLKAIHIGEWVNLKLSSRVFQVKFH